jgi:anti-anti-sigma regulatory factor
VHPAGPHRCLPFTERSTFVTNAVEFLAEGLALDQRVAYIADGGSEALRAELGDLGAAADRVTIVSITEMYGPDAAVDPAGQVAAYAQATAAALADGHRGFRVAAEVTPLVRSPEQHSAFAAYEHRVDALMARVPYAAMCAYDVRELGTDAVGDLACLHTEGGDDLTSFHLWSTGDGVALDGEIDGFDERRFRWALDQIEATSSSLVVDMRGVEFIDHRSLLTLAERAQRLGTPLILRGASTTVANIIEALGISELQIEPEPVR